MKTKEINFSPVHIRTRELKSGKLSIYLDINFNGQRSRENLKLFLLPETTSKAKLLNRETMKVAEEIKAKRVLEIQADEYDFNSCNAGHTVVLEWLEEQQKYYHDHGNNNYSKTIRSLIKHLAIFSKAGMMMKDITPTFLRKFLDYLNGDINSHTGGRLSPETVYTYFTVFCILLNKAVRLNLIPRNPFHRLGKAERPQRRTKKREYLTLEEVEKLAKAECDVWQVKYDITKILKELEDKGYICFINKSLHLTQKYFPLSLNETDIYNYIYKVIYNYCLIHKICPPLRETKALGYIAAKYPNIDDSLKNELVKRCSNLPKDVSLDYFVKALNNKTVDRTIKTNYGFIIE